MYPSDLPHGPEKQFVSRGFYEGLHFGEAFPWRAWVTPLAAWKFEVGNARQALLDHFQVSTLAGFGCEGQSSAIRAAGAMVQYLRETQMQGLAQITGLTTYSTSAFMTLDAATRRNLEITETIRGASRGAQGSLLGVLDATRTPMGARPFCHRLSS
jgi:DNA mismatch repair protein MutS